VIGLVLSMVLSQPVVTGFRSAPSDFVANTFHIHVVVDESISPDLLRSLARPQVTLWLQTNSNVLKDSTLENVARFDTAWIQLRAPLSSSQALVFKRVPKAGVWAKSVSDAKSLKGKLPGVRAMALDIDSLAELELIRGLRAQLVRWTPTEPVSVMAWSSFSQLAARRIVKFPAEQTPVMTCQKRSTKQPAVEISLAMLFTLGKDIFPCGTGNLVELDPKIEPFILAGLAARDPSAQLVFSPGAEEEKVRAVRELLKNLLSGPSR
jgi:hypothetical protein